jgi:hypothetical protein
MLLYCRPQNPQVCRGTAGNPSKRRNLLATPSALRDGMHLMPWDSHAVQDYSTLECSKAAILLGWRQQQNPPGSRLPCGPPACRSAGGGASTRRCALGLKWLQTPAYTRWLLVDPGRSFVPACSWSSLRNTQRRPDSGTGLHDPKSTPLHPDGKQIESFDRLESWPLRSSKLRPQNWHVTLLNKKDIPGKSACAH